MSSVLHLDSRPGFAATELLDHPQTDLVGATLRWKRYRPWTASWPAGECRLCGAQFTEGGTPGLNSGYSILGRGPAGQDDYYWICAVCYEMKRDHFCWTVLDTRNEATQPPDLLQAAFGWMAWAARDEADEPGRAITTPPLRSR
jgi:hypothetical protein